MISKPLWGLGLGLVAYAAYKSWNVQQSLKFLQYNISGLKLKMSNPFRPQVTFMIDVLNPNQTAVPINSFFGVVKAGDTVIADFENVATVTIGGNKRTTVEVAANVKALTIILAIIQRKSLKTVVLDGMIKTALFDMPISKTVAFAGLAGTNENPRGFLQYQPAMANYKGSDI